MTPKRILWLIVAAALALAAVVVRTGPALHLTGIGAIVLGMLAAQPVILVVALCQALRHKIVAGDPRLTFRTALESVVLAGGLNLIAPIRLSELLKATYLPQRVQVPTSVAISAIAVERLTDAVVVLAMIPLLPAVMFGGSKWRGPAVMLLIALLIAVLRARCIMREVIGDLAVLLVGSKRVRYGLMHHAFEARSGSFGRMGTAPDPDKWRENVINDTRWLIRVDLIETAIAVLDTLHKGNVSVYELRQRRRPLC